MSADKDCCKRCKKFVRPRQEGIQCDGCDNWQHRTCNTRISRGEYREAVRSGKGVDWRCNDCLNTSAGFLLPNAESTRVDESIPCMYILSRYSYIFITNVNTYNYKLFIWLNRLLLYRFDYKTSLTKQCLSVTGINTLVLRSTGCIKKKRSRPKYPYFYRKINYHSFIL